MGAEICWVTTEQHWLGPTTCAWERTTVSARLFKERGSVRRRAGASGGGVCGCLGQLMPVAMAAETAASVLGLNLSY
ncbi:hypothetical protein Lal_00010792 [Lupinus albus]|nr:hypothetical protein Lal_00010792 [Lupinus albus]